MQLTDKCYQLFSTKMNYSFQVFAVGLNEFGQIGIKDKTDISTPVCLNNKQSKLPNGVKGIAASKFHSVFWTDDELYTWGLNAGQLGQLNHDKIMQITQTSVHLSTNFRYFTVDVV